MSIDNVLHLAGQILLLAAPTLAAAYGLFVWLGKRTVTHWFEKRMESFKQAHQIELERYRFEVNSLFNRITKIHEKEFEVLPIAWKKLFEAFGRALDLVKPLQQYPDLNRLPADKLAAFAQSSELNDLHKKDLIEAQDKNEFYQEILYWYRLNKVRIMAGEFHNYLLENKIFISSDLYEQFGKIDNIMQMAIVDLEIGKEHKVGKMISDASKLLNEKGSPVIDQIEILVQKRLHLSDAI